MAAGYTLGMEPSGAESLVVAVKGTFTLPPGGKATQRVQVGIKLGAWQKVFTVLGDRVWRGGAVPRAGSPEPFEVMPISYDRAFGGVDNFHPDPSQHRPYLPNPVGRGYHRLLEPYLVDSTPLPSTEESNAPVA